MHNLRKTDLVQVYVVLCTSIHRKIFAIYTPMPDRTMQAGLALGAKIAGPGTKTLVKLYFGHVKWAEKFMKSKEFIWNYFPFFQ